MLNGGLRPGDLFVIGGPSGVGKTIFSLQVARNIVAGDPDATAMYICYEHDRAHLMMRLLCMESATLGLGDAALTLRRIGALIVESTQGGLLERLRVDPVYGAVVASMEKYADRLHLVKASGIQTNLDQNACGSAASAPAGRGLLSLSITSKKYRSNTRLPCRKAN